MVDVKMTIVSLFHGELLTALKSAEGMLSAKIKTKHSKLL